jgi:hypothetical protein
VTAAAAATMAQLVMVMLRPKAWANDMRRRSLRGTRTRSKVCLGAVSLS